MAQLIVRGVDEGLVRRLKRRAVEHGRSAEAEHREILRRALTGQAKHQSLRTLLLEMPDVGEDRDFERVQTAFRKVRV
ncbi:MAG TPA: hypothetical protein VFA59_01070 [Vicinamibacterales bacterium]|nr:hypothetical protein [Vicinamibacterales bacterium]